MVPGSTRCTSDAVANIYHSPFIPGHVVCRDTAAEAERERVRITTMRRDAPGFENFGQWVSGTQLEDRLKIEDYSVSNRGLRSGLIGTPV